MSVLSPLLALFAAIAIASFVRPIAREHAPPPVEASIDVPAFPAEVARPFSFGFRTFVSDLAFIGTIQVYGGLPKTTRTYAEGLADDRRMARLLTFATDLEPHFRGAYRFAGNALPHTTSDGKAAGVLATEALLKRGTREQPDDWRIWFALGSIETFYLGDNARAAQAMREASRLPGAPAYVPFLATRLQANAGDLDSAESMAREMAEQSTEEGTRREWEARLVDLAAERIALQIDAASARYKARTGQNPLNVLALVTSRDLTELPIDPRGGTFSIDADGMAQSTAGRRLKYRGKGNSFGLEVK